MSITMMISKTEYEADPAGVTVVTDYPGHKVTDYRHGYDCPHERERPAMPYADCMQGTGGCRYMEPLYMRTTHVGLVLATGEHNGYDDSDFFAVVWDADLQAPAEITYASTRGWSYPNGATIDATPEIIAKYQAYREAERTAAREEAERRAAADPTPGRRVSVTGGRKYRGAEGVVFWRGVNKFKTFCHNGYSRPDALHNQVVGIKQADGSKIFTAADHVQVI